MSFSYRIIMIISMSLDYTYFLLSHTEELTISSAKSEQKCLN